MMERAGFTPLALSAAVRPATSARMVLARALPSISWAVIGFDFPSKNARLRRRGGHPLPSRGRLLGLGYGCRLPKRDLQQIGHGIGVELFHDVGAVRLDRLDADAEVVGNLLVQPAGD